MKNIMRKQKIKIGWASRNVTPDGKVSLCGQFYVRITDEVRDPLTTTALALESEDGSEQAIIVSLDSVGIADYITTGCREKLADMLPDFNPDNLFISATHTAPDFYSNHLLGPTPPLGDDVIKPKEYGEFLIEKISGAAIEAWNSRELGALSWGKGNAVIGHNRRVSYFDGSTVMYGKTDNPEFSHIEGYEDHGVDMLFTYDAKHNLTGMLLNVPCPSQCSEHGFFISADYWHEARNKIRKHHGEELFILPQCGAAGDISPHYIYEEEIAKRMFKLKGYSDNPDMAKRQDIADKLSTAVNEVLPLASKDIRDELEFGHSIINHNLTRRLADKNDVEKAKQEVKKWTAHIEEIKDMEPLSIEYSSTYRHIHFNKNVIKLYDSQQRGEMLEFPIELHCLRIGDIAMCTNRFEFYLDYGVRIKSRSKALQTFVVQLAGQGSYLPTERAMQGGSYGAFIASTPIGPEGGQIIVNKSVEEINRMFEDGK